MTASESAMAARQPRRSTGFTIVELTVVISIICIFASISVSALSGANNANELERATQEILTAFREVQNKSISEISVNDGSIPAAWGVEVKTDGDKTVTPFYVKSTVSGKTTIAERVLSYPNMDSIVVNAASTGSFSSVYTSPFGKYYTGNVAYSDLTWYADNMTRPYDIIPKNLTASQLTIVLNKKGATTTIHVSETGGVYAE